MSLKSCIRKAGRALTESDKDLIYRNVDSGMSDIEAVAAVLAEANQEMITLTNRITVAGGTVERTETPPAAPEAEVAPWAPTLPQEVATARQRVTEARKAEVKAFTDVQRGMTSQPSAVRAFAKTPDDQKYDAITKAAVKWLTAERLVALKAEDTPRVEALDKLVANGKLIGPRFTEEWYEAMQAEFERKAKQLGDEKKAPRKKKYGSTGKSLRRWFDGAKASLGASEKGSLEELYTQYAKVTTRSDLFSVDDLVANDATPGLQRYMEQVRNRLPTFSTEFSNKFKRWYGRTSVKDVLGEIDDSPEKRAEIKAFAEEYLTYMAKIAEAMQGHRNIEQAAKALRDVLKEVRDSEDRKLTYFLDNKLRGLKWPDKGEVYPYTELGRMLKVETTDSSKDVSRATPVKRKRIGVKDMKRTGLPDVRKGKDKKPKDLKSEFGFADVTIGEWVTGDQETAHVNGSFEAFADLAKLLGWNQKDMSFGGSLHYSIGALGQGRHAAHYSPNQGNAEGTGTVQVINVTNTSGDGTVAHEFGHAIDYNSRDTLASNMHPAVQQLIKVLKNAPLEDQVKIAERQVENFLNGHIFYQGMKRKGEVAMARFYLERQLNRVKRAGGIASAETEYYREAKRGDKNSRDPYWAKPEELFARAFEAYMYDQLGEAQSEYLVTEWVSDGYVKKPPYRFMPYPTGEERAQFATVMERFIKALSVKNGKVMIDDSFLKSFEEERQAIIDRLTDLLNNLESRKEELQAEAQERVLAKKKAKEAKAKAEAEAVAAELAAVLEASKTIDEQLATMTAEELDQELDDIFSGVDEVAADQFHQETTAAGPAAEPVPTEPSNAKAEKRLADRVAQMYQIAAINQQFKERDNRQFFVLADTEYGGTRGDGTYESKDAYDAMELGVNMAIRDAAEVIVGTPPSFVINLLDRLTAALPTQSNRSEKQIDYQQFSTPPAYAYVAGWVANISANDRVLEPSAGTGALAIHAQMAGAEVIVNELEISRGQLLEHLKPSAIKAEDGRYIGDILRADEKPTVVLMNPPFSADAVGGSKNATKTGAQHVESALQALQPEGRLVAIVGTGMARGKPAFKEWWKKIDAKYMVRAAIEVNGSNYRKYGTTFDNVILVIDKTDGASNPITGRAETITELAQMLQGVRDARTQPTAAQPSVQTGADRNRPAAGPGAALPASSDAAGAGVGGPRTGEPGAGAVSTGPAGPDRRGQAGDVTGVDEAGRGVDQPRGAAGRGAAGSGPVANPDTAPGDSGADRDLSVGELAKSAAKHGIKFSDETLKGLAKLFGGPGTLRSFPGGFDENTYQQAKPHFERAYQEAVAAGKDVAAMVRAMIEWAGVGIEPYLRRWLGERRKEVQEGTKQVPELAARVDDEVQPVAEGTAELTEDVYETYRPKHTLKGAKPHPGDLAETAAMGDVSPPPTNYVPDLPASMIESGALSDAQIEAVILAGAAHGTFLPETDGVSLRKGFLIGDGTGLGKSRELLAIIVDNMRRGRNKALFVSKNEGLVNDLKSDFKELGQNEDLIRPLSKGKPGGEKGILFTTYSTLGNSRSLAKKAAGTEFVQGRRVASIEQPTRVGTVKRTTVRGKVPVKWDGVAKVQQVARNALETLGEKKDPGNVKEAQIIDWLGQDFDGVLIFDEAHLMANSLSPEGGFRSGGGQASEQALAGIDLANRLPKARVVYATATAAQEVRNLAYMDRLGLWGAGTPFADKTNFVGEIEGGGVAAMELVAKDMKAMGSYLARNISFKGLTRDTVNHVLTPEQRDIYNELARAWGLILDNMDTYMKATGADKSSRAKTRAASLLWSFQQRFFNQIITTMKMPSIIEHAQQAMADGYAPVFQLVNTGAQATKRSIGRIEQQGGSLEDIDTTNKEDVIELVQKVFPTQQYQEVVGDDGNSSWDPVYDASGSPVESAEAVAARDELIQNLRDIRVPEAPLDILINSFGPDTIAEVTGRKQRVIRDPSTDEVSIESTPNTEAEIEAFQNGKKKALVFSDAGGTGKSYHADLRVKNQAKRFHYLIQGGWSATRAVQGFGRTHRSNQRQAPELILTTTDVQAEKRFTSSIARRLDQLGALTRGSRKTGGQGIFSAEDNLENEYASGALTEFMQAVARGEHENIHRDDIKRELGIDIIDDAGAVSTSRLPDVKTFLNRLLSTQLDRMDLWFNGFFERLEVAIEAAKLDGTYDAGVENLSAETITISHRETVYTDTKTGAETEYVKFELTDPVQYRTMDDVAEMAQSGLRQLRYFATNDRSGKLYAFFDAPSKTEKGGNVTERYRRVGISTSSLIDKFDGSIEGWGKKYTKVEAADVKALWDKEIAEAPPTRTWNEHMIVGAVLPVWDRLVGPTKVFRTVAEGERFIGRIVHQRDLDTTLRNLGAAGAKVTQDPATIVQRVLRDGYGYRLSNRWALKRKRVGSEYRVQIDGPTNFGNTKLQAEQAGAVAEIIQHRTFWFATEAVVGKLLAGNVDVVQEVPPTGEDEVGAYSRLGFYSPLARAAQNLPQEKGSPLQMLAMLKKSPGVKAEELEWVGVEEWLNAYHANAAARAGFAGEPYPETVTVTRQEIVDFVAGNGVRVEEVTYRDDNVTPSETIWIEDPSDDDPDGMYVVHDDRNPISEHTTRAEAEFNAEEYAQQRGTSGDTQYQQYTLPGGTNYREVLLTLPNKDSGQRYSGAIIPAESDGPGDADSILTDIDVEGFGDLEYGRTESGMIEFENLTQDQLAAFNNIAVANGGVVNTTWTNMAGDKTAPVYTGGHWSEPNVLAHLRLNDRKGPNGEKILFIEEIQSDWHQAGRKRGYEGDKEDRKDLPTGFTIVNTTEEARRDPQFTVPDNEPDRFQVRGPGYSSGVIDTYAEALDDAYRQYGYSNEPGVPNAPFKGNAWVELALKRALRLATEEGYDQIAWTSGEQQAERYNLSKYAESIEYRKNGKNYEVYVIGTDGGTVVHQRSAISPNDLRALVGQELTDKIEAGEGDAVEDDPYSATDSTFKSIRFDTLNFGGEGMKSFYDRTFKNLMQKQVKKLDKSVKVGATSIDKGWLPMKVKEGPTKYRVAQGTPGFGDWYIVHDNDWGTTGYKTKKAAEAAIPNKPSWGIGVDSTGQGKYRLDAAYGVYDTKAAAQERLEQIEERRKVEGEVWAVPISSMMQRKVMGGLPLFQRQKVTDGYKAEAIERVLKKEIKAVAPILSVRVVQSVSDIPNNAVPGDAEGVFFNRGGVYLVADNISAKRLHAVFRHEVIGHAAVENHPDFEKWVKLIQNARKVDGNVRKLAAEVALRQGLLNQRDEAREIIALMAERGVKSSILDRITAAIRAFFRGIGLFKDVTDAEIRTMLSRAHKAFLSDAELAANAPHIAVSQTSSPDEILAAIDRLQPSDRIDSDALFSRPVVLGGRATGTDEIEEAMARVMVTPHEDLTVRDRLRVTWRKLTDIQEGRIKQGLLDQYHSIRLLEEGLFGEVLDATDSAYKAALATQNLPSVMAAVLQKGAPKLVAGAFQVEAGRKGVIEIFKPITDHIDGNLLAQWEFYAAGVRAQRLINETNEDGSPREKNFTQEDIDLAIGLQNQYPEFYTALKEWNEFNSQILDMAQDAGVINAAERKVWQHNDYVPFYRAMMDEEKATGPGAKRGLEGQRSGIRRLTGKDAKLGSVFENMMMNTAHLIDASFKNLAMQRTTEMALETGAMEKMPPQWRPKNVDNRQIQKRLEEAGIELELTAEEKKEYSKLFVRVTPQGPDVVSALWNGKPTYYRVTDPMLLSSVASVGPQAQDAVMKVFSIPKKLLTTGVTASPEFMLANLIRDSLSTWVVSDVNKIPIVDSLKGLSATFKQDEDITAIMMAGAGGGGFYDANPEEIRKLLAKKMPRKTAKGFLGTVLGPKNIWQFWQKVGASTENATRVAIFRRVIQNGGSVAEAAYQARDVLNFTMHGDFAAMRFLTRAVPFLNARVQGLYRLARGFKQAPMAFTMKGGLLFLATMALLARNDERDEYEELPEWEKDVYWHVFLNERGTPVGAADHWRIPKPFEVGSLFGMIPERITRLALGRDRWDIFQKQMATMLSETLAFNPLPQLVKPAVEQYANRSFFTDSPIVGMGEEHLNPEAQYNAWTSEFARVMAEAMPDFAPEWMRSPKRLQHLVRAYFGTLGTYAMSTADSATRLAGDYPSRPRKKIYEYPLVQRFLRDPVPRYTKFADQMYDMVEEANALQSTINRYREQGLLEKAQELRDENFDKLKVRKQLNSMVGQIRKINNQQRMVMYSTKLTPEEKQQKLDALTEKKNELLRKVQPFEEFF